MNSLLALLTLAAAGSTAPSDWPAWRGPKGDGVAPEGSPPVSWDRETNVRWRAPLAQPANGSPIVVGERVLLTMPEDPEGHRRSLLCFDRADGALEWTRAVELGRTDPTHETNPYGGSTPASDGERVVVWHASAGLHAYDLAGEPLWSRDLGEFRHMWGYGSSPVIHEGKAILNTGPVSDTQPGFVIAVDLASGETVWRADEPNHLDEQAIEEKRLIGSWATPVLTRHEGREVLLCSQPTRVVAYDPKTGEELWWSAGVSGSRGDLVYSSPVLAGELCVVQGGYQGPTLGVRLGGEGEVTASHRAWHHAERMSNCASGIYADGHVFLPDMGGFLHCLDVATGEPRWRERVGRGATWGSIVSAGGRLYVLNQAGTTIVFEPSAEALEVLSENALGETTNSTPAVAGDELFLRTHEALYCIAEPR